MNDKANGKARISRTFEELAGAGQSAFMPFLVAGDPDIDTTARLIVAMEEAGADLLELGIPYSDPLADGPVIQDAFARALAGGLHVKDAIDSIRRSRDAGATLPIVTMVSYSLVYRYGCERYVADVAGAGGDGLIVPDLAVDESEHLCRLCSDAGLALIFLVTPTTEPERERRILANSSGFIYCVSVVGITGERDKLPEGLAEHVGRLKSQTELPVCVGFGVSRPDQAAQVAAVADGVIVGSALVKCIRQADDDKKVADAGQFADSLATAVHNVSPEI